MVVHVRNATVGDPDYLNCHPFRHGAWVFAHNGTIFEFEKLWVKMEQETLPLLQTQAFGSTDSEKFFYYLLSALVRAGFSDHGRGSVDALSASDVLREAVGRIYGWASAAGVHPPILNYVLTNGQVLFAQRAGLELFLASQKLTCADFHTCSEPDKVCMDRIGPFHDRWEQPPSGPLRKMNHILISSEPIGAEDVWEEIPEGMLVTVDAEMNLYINSGPKGFTKCPSPPAPPPRLHEPSAALLLWR
jgi:glutamine amidotransferase